MGEKQQNTDKGEDARMLHSQHARILKEEDEFWISSEDLNTENSSDEDKLRSKPIYNKKKVKSKYRKRSTPSIHVQRPSVSSGSSAGTSTALDDRLLMPAVDDLQLISDESRTSDEECMSISSELLSKRLSLDNWRPTRGSLTIQTLEEPSAEVSRNFYDTVLGKLRSLKSCPSLKSARLTTLPEKETSEIARKTFKFLKRTPEVMATLDLIEELNGQIRDKIAQYKAAREGTMANCSLTDDQKKKIEDMLKDIDEYQLEDGELSTTSTAPMDSNEQDNIEDARESNSNAFVIPDNERSRINEINHELEKMVLDRHGDGGNSTESNVVVVKDEEYWKQFIVESALSDIDRKLEQLQESYVEDEVKLKSLSQIYNEVI